MATQEHRTEGSSLSTPRVVVSPWIVLIVLALGFFMILLDTTIVNVAIPSMINGLHASFDQILWVLNAYILVYAVLLITAGRLGDMIGPKKLYTTGLILFTISSFACGWAQTPHQLIFFRILQGVGGAILTPQSMSIITFIFPPEKRGAAFGIWAAAAGLAAVTGPTVGGLLTTAFSWRAIFFVNVPIGIATLVLVYLIMPELTIHRKHRLDVPGVALASAGLFAAIFALIEGQRYDWGPISTLGSFSIGSIKASLYSIPTLLIAGLALLVAFAIWEAHTEEPLLPLSLFKDRNFAVCNGISFITSFGILAMFLPLTIFLQSVLGLSALDAGIALVPSSLTSMIFSPIVGNLADRFSAKWLLSAGLALYALGMGLLVQAASLHATGATFTPALLIAGVGMGFVWAPLVSTAMRNISPTQAGAASGFINTVRQVGMVLGTAVVGAILQHQLASELGRQAARAAGAAHLPAPEAKGFVDGMSRAARNGFQLGRGQSGGSTTPQLQTLAHSVFQQSYLNAVRPTLAVPIAVVLIGAAAAMLLKTSRRQASEEAAFERREERAGVAAAGE